MPTPTAKPLALYSRVSTDDQHAEAQLAELRAYASRRGLPAIEYVDKGISGRRRSRPAFDGMLAAARRREVGAIVVVRLDRAARSLAHLAQLGEELSALGVELVSLREAIDTSTASGRALFGMCAVFAALEADLIRERTVAGLAAARARGAKIGRPALLDARGIARARRLRAAGRSFRQIAALLEVSPGTIVNVVREAVPSR